MASLCASFLRGTGPVLLSRNHTSGVSLCAAAAVSLRAASSSSSPRHSFFGGFAQPIGLSASQSTFVHSSVRNFSASLAVAAATKNDQKMGLPRVFFDMAADNQVVGRVIMEVSRVCLGFLIVPDWGGWEWDPGIYHSGGAFHCRRMCRKDLSYGCVACLPRGYASS